MQGEEKRLQNKERDAKRKQTERARQRQVLEKYCESHPDLSHKLKLRGASGRPRLEVDQPALLQAIVDIVKVRGGAEARRRSEALQLCMTLDQLTAELNEIGYRISRSATYLRLLPRRANAGDGPRHVQTVPVKLVKAQASEHHRHPDTAFAVASIRHLECLVSVLGSKQVFYVSQDDKASVPLGIMSAKKLAPMMMHLEYTVRLPDHDFVVAPAHKLKPSVYAACEVKDGQLGDYKAVTYSGPTYVAIRSGKHSSSTATSHAADFRTLLELPEFKNFTFGPDGKIKPIVVFSVDGGPDESPKSPKVLREAVNHFLAQELDALFIVANAPGTANTLSPNFLLGAWGKAMVKISGSPVWFNLKIEPSPCPN